MKQYYLHDGQEQLGPFSSEEIIDKHVTADTYVWKEGMADWVKASEMPELRVLLLNTPPRLKAAANINEPQQTSRPPLPESSFFKTGNRIGKNWKIVSFFILLAFIAIIIISRNQHVAADTEFAFYADSTVFVSKKTPAELRIELQKKERKIPEKYLEVRLTRKKNSEAEHVFEGTISNTASTVIFKDIKVRIAYLSKTKAVIGSDSFIVYEAVSPKQTARIKKVKFFPPADTDEYVIDIVSAGYVD